MKKTTATLLAGALGLSLIAGLVPAKAQTADNPLPPPAAVQNGVPGPGPDAAPSLDANADDGQDDGWGWWGHKHGRHGGHDGRRGEGRMDNAEGGPMGGHRGMRGPMMIDVNGDGVIGADEAAAMADGMFMHMDHNMDGVVDKAEFTDGPGRGHGWWAGWFNSTEIAAIEKLRADRFAALDTDKDGKVTKAEFFADAQARLASADTDKDGKVSPWEFRALPRM